MAKLLNYDRWFQKKYAVQLRKFNDLKLKFQIHCDENDVYFLVKEDGDGHISRILWEMIPVKEMSTEKFAEFSTKFFAALPSLHHELRADDPLIRNSVLLILFKRSLGEFTWILRIPR